MFLLTLSIAANATRDEVMLKALENYKALRANDVSDGSTTVSSRLSTPSAVGNPTPSPKRKSPCRLGNALIPVRSEKWKVERRKHWTDLRKL
jgi:hypothetical protein